MISRLTVFSRLFSIIGWGDGFDYNRRFAPVLPRKTAELLDTGDLQASKLVKEAQNRMIKIDASYTETSVFF